MFCYRCGNRLPEASIFCNRCGIRLQTTTERMRHSKPFETPDSEYDPYDPYEVPRNISANRSDQGYELEESVDDFEDSDLEVEEEWSEFDGEDGDEVEEEEIQVDPPSHSYRGPKERVIFSINPAFYPVSSAYVLSTFVALLLAMIVAFFKGGFLLALGSAMISFVPSVIRHIRHIHTIFTLTTIKLEISEGLFSKSTRNIPLRHIQDVAVRENFKERLLGIGDIVVDTPSMESRLTLNNVKNPRHYADLILEQLERWS